MRYENFPCGSGDAVQYHFSRAVADAKKLGFQYCAYGIKSLLPATSAKGVSYSNYPEDWCKLYFNKKYAQIDPSLAHALKSSQPLIWGSHFFSETRELWDDMKKFGLTYGWTHSQPIGAAAIALFTLATNRVFSDIEMSLWKGEILWFSHKVHHDLSPILIGKLFPPSIFELTFREKEILCWTCQGKTSFSRTTIA